MISIDITLSTSNKSNYSYTRDKVIYRYNILLHLNVCCVPVSVSYKIFYFKNTQLIKSVIGDITLEHELCILRNFS